ncbi:hypothetical protein PV10_05241 [Exophiala mesophila]|uniref:FAS1 domain-containing protein n=1 Tax=Exophiala mesophila TaxID=212818 RepID=A0A0D1WXG5_EXOME|nr:uncharacterized protein PV10_05241 [Exophiala mesophila]KIV94085.1 hypothetical protein PV10_05241 [Exophiala mesophila]
MVRLLCAIILSFALALAQDLTVADTIKARPELSTLNSQLSRFTGPSTQVRRSKITLVAPRNSAFAALTAAGVSVTADLLSYHILNDSYPNFPSGSNQFVGTFLDSPSGKDKQLVAARKAPVTKTTSFTSGLRHRSNSVGEVVKCSNGVIYIVDKVLTIPESFTSTYAQSSRTGRSPFSDSEVFQDGSDKLMHINWLSGATVFLPINRSFRDIGSLVNSWTEEDWHRILSYHIVDEIIPPGPDGLPTGNYTTMEGSDLTITDYHGDRFVNNAKVSGPYDWIFDGGVIYTIFGVLNPDNTTSDPSNANSGIAFTGAAYATDLTFPSAVTEPNRPKQLSVGAKAAIGVGAGVAAIFIALFIAWLCYRCRSARREKKQALKNDFDLSPMSMSQKNLTSDTDFVNHIPVEPKKG